MACEKRKACITSRVAMLLLRLLSLLLVEFTITVASPTECPVIAGALLAYPGEDTMTFHDNFDPVFKTNIDAIDKRLFDEIRCKWEVIPKTGHKANVVVTDFKLLPQKDSDDADCLQISDGDDLLADLCGGDTPVDSYTSSSEDQSLYIIYTRGERTGHRMFRISYKALPRSKDFIIKIAIIASCSVATIAVTFLVFKFTHCCRPCRKRCCPALEEEQPQRELQPLTYAQTALPPTVISVSETTAERGLQDGQAMGLQGRQISAPPALALSGGTVPEPNDEEQSPAPGEPPPSYDSIFGQGINDAKANI